MSLGSKTATAADAHERTTIARGGSLAGRPTVEYLRALRGDLAAWLSSVESALDYAEKKKEAEHEMESYRAGERFVLDTDGLDRSFDVEEFASDLAEKHGLDPEAVAEGMRDALGEPPAEFFGPAEPDASREREPTKCELNGGCAGCNWGAADH